MSHAGRNRRRVKRLKSTRQKEHAWICFLTSTKEHLLIFICDAHSFHADGTNTGGLGPPSTVHKQREQLQLDKKTDNLHKIDIIHSFGGEPTLLALHQCLFNNVLGLKYKLLLLVVALIIIIGSFGGPIIRTGIRHFDEVSADKRSI